MVLQDKIQVFLNRAQSKICELALDSAKDLSEAYLNSNAITLSIELMDVVEALQDEVLDWTDKELESIIDHYTWKARLNDIALLVFEDKQQTIIVVDSSTVDNSWVPSFNSLSAEVDANHQYTINEAARLDSRINNLDFSNLVPQELLDEVEDNSTARHTHNNKTVLDGITQGKIDEIGLNTTHRNTPQIHITNTERNLWNAKVDTATLNSGLATKANTVHQHEIQDVNGLTQALEDRNPIPGPAGQDGMQPVLIAGTITDGAYSITVDSTNPQSPILNLVVPKGEDGTDFHIDEYLLSAQRLDSVKYDSVDEGYSILGTDNGVMYYRNPTDDLGNFISASTSTGWYAVQYAGANGWSPVFAIENVSVSRSVYKLVSWTGGTGTPPAFNNVYVTPYGYSPNEYEAANIQGIPGPTGAAGKVMFPDVAGDTATKANYDSYPKDFVYLDTTLGLIYIKRSDTSGNWSEGYQWKGDTGNQGPAGSTGPAGADSTVPGPQGPIGETGQGYTWKGQWNAITPYVPYDNVSDLGFSYTCIAPITGGNNPATNTAFEILAAKGADGTSSGGGHTIKDSNETFTQRSGLRFEGNVSVSDDSVEGDTVITLPANTAANTEVDATGFNGNLDSTVTNIQILAQKVDDLTIASDVETLNVTTPLQTNKLLKVNTTGDGVDYTDFNADSVLQTDAIDYSSPAWMVGESRLLLTTKVSSVEGNFEGAAELMDLILPPATLATLESSDANWVNETKTVTGGNSTYALGRTGQFGWLSDRTFVQCTSATYAVSGSATFNRNRAVDALSISDTQDLAVINLLEPSRTGGTDDDGWNLTTQTKLITTVPCKVGTYWVGGTNGDGNWFTCFAQSGTSYYWKRLGTPASIQRPITTVSHPTLTGRLLAKADWATSLYTVQAGDETSYQDQTFWDTATRAYFIKVTTTQWEKIK